MASARIRPRQSVAWPLPHDELTVNDLNQAAVRVVNNNALAWVIVGDRAKIEQGIRELNIGPIQVIDADAQPVGGARAAAPTGSTAGR